jgi:BMC domain.
VVERQFGYLEIHGGTDEVQAAASAVLGALGATARDASRPEILASKIITMLDPQQAFLVNRNKIGSMALAGESLFVLEMRPASYAILAANEAEKAARIKLVDYRMIGATGRAVPVRPRPTSGRPPRRPKTHSGISHERAG